MDLWSPITDIKGIGPKTADTLNRAGIFTVRDLLYHLPRAYNNFQQTSRIADLRPGQVTIKAMAKDVKIIRKRRNLSIVEASLFDESGAIRAIWFNQPYRAKQLAADQFFYFSGTMSYAYGRYQLSNPAVLQVQPDQSKPIANSLKFQPVYSSVFSIKSNDFKKFIASLRPTIAKTADLVPNFPGRAEALLKVHFPETPDDAKTGRSYLAVEELFGLLLASRLNRDKNRQLRTTPVSVNLPLFRKFITTLPFTLTNAQRRASWEIIQDLASPTPMNRLLQGDVGSGKTLVAALAAFVAAKAGLQVALLAPTEVLASQHADSLARLFDKHLRIALLTGSTRQKVPLKRAIAQGEVDLIIGTHAILTDDTHFAHLGLAIIDEQHRFGVGQRQKLLSKAPTMPHLLSMTATPIPRSLQLTIFGDLAVSILDELPDGRQTIKTQLVSPNSTTKMWDTVAAELARGHQIYYICKKIDEKGNSDLSSVKRELQKIQKLFPEHQVALLHGRMSSRKKETTMTDFVTGHAQILVSTTVIEVGVDVPNATVIIIADADQYGLSQLHQLRGRVGRGNAASYCFLINSTSNAPTRRLREIEASQDGFHLAEVDLKLRGPGEIYGTLQHGVLDLHIASITDTKLIHRAEQLVKDFLKHKYNVLEYKELSAIVRQYQRITTLN